MLQLLSSGKPVSAGDYAAQIQQPVEQVNLQFEFIKQTGFEFDGAGNLAGAALTLNSTPHHFQVKGHDLFAWCALDTIFLTIFIGEPAFIKSKCPITGEMIELTVSPHGIETYSPPDTGMRSPFLGFHVRWISPGLKVIPAPRYTFLAPEEQRRYG
jgi:alkylmercury lyase